MSSCKKTCSCNSMWRTHYQPITMEKEVGFGFGFGTSVRTHLCSGGSYVLMRDSLIQERHFDLMIWKNMWRSPNWKAVFQTTSRLSPCNLQDNKHGFTQSTKQIRPNDQQQTDIFPSVFKTNKEAHSVLFTMEKIKTINTTLYATLLQQAISCVHCCNYHLVRTDWVAQYKPDNYAVVHASKILIFNYVNIIQYCYVNIFQYKARYSKHIWKLCLTLFIKG